MSKYKYLGTYFSPKLTMKAQIETIQKKSNFLYVKLYPYLSKATADARKDIWKTMVMPLFNALFVLVSFGQSDTEVERVNTVMIGTFKRYLMIPKTTNSEIVWSMIGDDVNEIRMRMKFNTAEKWFARRKRREPELSPKIQYTNYLKGIPNDWCQILKQQCSLCQICKNSSRNAQHMKERHQIEIPSYKEIWEAIKRQYEIEQEKHNKKKTIMKIKRGIFLRFWKPILKNFKEEIEEKFTKLYGVKTNKKAATAKD